MSYRKSSGNNHARLRRVIPASKSEGRQRVNLSPRESDMSTVRYQGGEARRGGW